MKICVITGGAGGMGLECAKIMGTREKLLLVDVSQEKLDEAVEFLAGQGIEGVETALCDISDREAVKALAAKAAALGEIGSVLHLAGVGSYCPAEVVIKVNALGVYNMIEEFYAVMGEGSNMITVNSLSSHTTAPMFENNEETDPLFDNPGDPGFCDGMYALCDGFRQKTGGTAPMGGLAYGFAKYFSRRYTLRNVMRFADKGIRLNTVTPGVIATPMGLKEKDGCDRMKAQMAIKDEGTPEEMATAICWLTEPAARVISGIDLPVDGGFLALKAYPKQVEA
ncbi:MAG: SDR family oxidoreductase [Eggerthellaceae bacterium]|nr:SDR family oxidoreductase [Eggerthellaceae bacterium]